MHYSTVTRDIARYYVDSESKEVYTRNVRAEEWGDIFLDELSEGVLVHTKSIMPHETMSRNSSCQIGSPSTCLVGYACPETTRFQDSIHQKNLFRDEHGNYCNCWPNLHLEDKLIPALHAKLNSMS